MALRAILLGMAMLCTLAAASHSDESIFSAEGPFPLSAGPVEIRLHGAFALSTKVSALAPGERIYLVLRELSADQQPGVVFSVYLGSAAEAKKDDRRFLGTVNFFNAVPVKGEKPGARPGSTRSIDVTAALKKLGAASLLTESATLTIEPSSPPAVAAKPVIGRAELVVRTRREGRAAHQAPVWLEWGCSHVTDLVRRRS